MTPTSFPEANMNLLAPPDMPAGEWGTLPVFTDGMHCVSRWRPSLRERLRVFLGGTIWMTIGSSTTRHPASLGTRRPFMRPKQVEKKELA